MMARQGITFTLEAYPVPDTFGFIYHGNQTGNDGRRVSSNRFSSYCQQHQVQTFMSICVIAPVDVPKDHLGYYTASLSNSLDTVNVSFCINTEVVEGRTPMVWKVVGATAAVVVVVLITIIIVVARRRCQACWTPQPLRKEITSFHEDVELNPIRRQRQQSDQSHQDSDDDIPQPQLPPAGVPISGARSRQMSEEENHYTRISDSSSLSYEHAYDVTQRRGSRDEHCYTDLTMP
ncbi:uncharacterized protein [Littorina saxatilis]|uniref:uncharacterized protein n=1 Tax=Littorina saxatilis TaxID=31220 RepID=UPI0038B57BDA